MSRGYDDEAMKPVPRSGGVVSGVFAADVAVVPTLMWLL
jgi:hypothetical protein